MFIGLECVWFLCAIDSCCFVDNWLLKLYLLLKRKKKSRPVVSDIQDCVFLFQKLSGYYYRKQRADNRKVTDEVGNGKQ